jgi:hypothetical protein
MLAACLCFPASCCTVPASAALFQTPSCSLLLQVVNLVTNRVARLLGKVENTERFLRVALYQVSSCCVDECQRYWFARLPALHQLRAEGIYPALVGLPCGLSPAHPRPSQRLEMSHSSSLLPAAGGRLQATGKVGAAGQQVGRARPAAADVRVRQAAAVPVHAAGAGGCRRCGGQQVSSRAPLVLPSCTLIVNSADSGCLLLHGAKTPLRLCCCVCMAVETS